MGKVVSKLNVFNACRNPEAEQVKEEKKEEAKKPIYKSPRKKRDIKKNQAPLEVSSSEIQLDEEVNDFTQIGFRNDDGYFSLEEIEYYKKLFGNEKIIQKPLTHIKYFSYNLKLFLDGNVGKY